MNKNKITVETIIKQPLEKVWEYWNDIKHISIWYHANDDWAAEALENNLEIGGRFKTKMFAKDKSARFDFEETYTQIKKYELIEYVLDDERKVEVNFILVENGVKIEESFETENSTDLGLQHMGWQAILDNFKKYVEKN